MNVALDLLPKLLERFGSIENQVKNLLTDVSDVTSEIKENPSPLIWGSEEKSAPADKNAAGRR